ncbi:hypothetical protein [uncultured Helicobacter sp.]|uniref:hypothetical protein n=1 Tax=uncultured Helicobacter sp. TaxID=175537 RepID=UPI003750EFB1
MCGILGSIPATSNTAHFLQALHTLSHRGPDDFGVYHSDEISLGHRRLAIIDTSTAGQQPMTSNRFNLSSKTSSGGGGNTLLSLMERFITL